MRAKSLLPGFFFWETACSNLINRETSPESSSKTLFLILCDSMKIKPLCQNIINIRASRYGSCSFAPHRYGNNLTSLGTINTVILVPLFLMLSGDVTSVPTGKQNKFTHTKGSVLIPALSLMFLLNPTSIRLTYLACSTWHSESTSVEDIVGICW
jgi:hypothetical protein